jgi:16S rRNA (cytosine1407-C5)-methyltransferase
MSRKKSKPSRVVPAGNALETLLEKYQCCLNPQDFEKLQHEVSQPLRLSIRINLLRHEPQEIREQLTRTYGWQLEQIPFCASGFRVGFEQNTPSSTIEHRLGDFYIQETASMLPAELFDLEGCPRPLILDMAASPGGKTIHLVDLSKDRGLIIANDASRSRIPALQVVLQKWGAINQVITCLPGEYFGRLLEEIFDFVLLDAPCSMEGLRASSSHAMRAISDKERQRLALRQEKLLESALRAAKVGGQIVYSTCTLAPEENESVLAALLEKFGDTFSIDEVAGRLAFKAPGLERYGTREYPPAVKHALRLWPHISHTAGFFTARLSKQKSFPLQKEIPIDHGRRFASALLPNNQLKTIINRFQDQYGFDLLPLMEQQNLGLSRHGNHLMLVPLMYADQFSQLACLSIGLRLGEQNEDDLIPSHAFAARFGKSFQKGRVCIEEKYLPQWLRGEDLRGYSVSGVPKTKVVVVTDPSGRNLGRGKVLASQLKNLLPNRLF